MKKDFYFSQKAWEKKIERSNYEQEFRNEVLIGHKWMIFTEQIDSGRKPVSKHSDLIFLGTADTGNNIVRYNKISTHGSKF